MEKPNIVVLGDGGWGTTLAILLHQKNFKVTLWSAFKDYIFYLDKKRINTKFLPNIKIPKGIQFTHNLKEAISKKQLIIFALLSQYLRKILKRIKKFDYPHEAIYLSVVKGIETSTLKRMSEVIFEELGEVKLAVLSGPNIAQEIARGIPSATIIASRDKKIREYLQNIFSTKKFLVYTTDDIIGVELGGSFKNIIAISCGISDGLGFGTNTKALLLTRGLEEISCLGEVMGARRETFMGISGLGDLMTTCISPYSRNRFIGEEIARGKSLKEIETQMQMVAEGVATTKSAYKLSLKYKVNMPITKEVYFVLFKNKPPLKSFASLLLEF